MNRIQVKQISTLFLGASALAAGLAFAAREQAPESAETRAIKRSSRTRSSGSRALRFTTSWRPPATSVPTSCALPEYMNQMFLPSDEWDEAFKGPMRYRRQIQPEHVTYLSSVDENGLFVPTEPAADAPPLIKENQKKLKEQYDRAIASMKANEARGAKIMRRRDPSVRPRSDQDVTYGYNGKTLWSRRAIEPKGFSYEVWSTTSQPNFFQVSSYLGAVGLHVPDPAGSEPAQESGDLPAR